MTFGKNRVQYNNFYWSFYRFEKFDVYFNEYGRDLAEYTGQYANKQLIELESFLDHQLHRRLILLMFNKLSDFRQSNIGLISGMDEYNLGGVSTIIDNKVFLFYEGDHRKYNQAIKKALSYTIVNEMLYGNPGKPRTKNSSKMVIPDWYIKGMVSFLSNHWDFETENMVKDEILSGKFKKLNRLEKEDAEIAGHSFWKFIADTYGINIKFHDRALMLLAANAFKENTGARGLVSAVERALLPFERTLPSKNIKFFPVTKKVVENPEKALEQFLNSANSPEIKEVFERRGKQSPYFVELK
jgi:hypothetical protein